MRAYYDFYNNALRTCQDIDDLGPKMPDGFPAWSENGGYNGRFAIGRNYECLLSDQPLLKLFTEELYDWITFIRETRGSEDFCLPKHMALLEASEK